MAKLTEQDIAISRLTLMKHLDRALSELDRQFNPDLVLPNEMAAFMADASIAVLRSAAGVNDAKAE